MDQWGNIMQIWNKFHYWWTILKDRHERCDIKKKSNILDNKITERMVPSVIIHKLPPPYTTIVNLQAVLLVALEIYLAMLLQLYLPLRVATTLKLVVVVVVIIIDDDDDDDSCSSSRSIISVVKETIDIIIHPHSFLLSLQSCTITRGEKKKQQVDYLRCDLWKWKEFNKINNYYYREY